MDQEVGKDSPLLCPTAWHRVTLAHDLKGLENAVLHHHAFAC
jgi:hypothetical protein